MATRSKERLFRAKRIMASRIKPKTRIISKDILLLFGG
jgi:hypothetical protein